LFFYGLFAMAVSRCPMVWRDFVLMTIFVMLITAGLSQQRSDGALSHQGLWVAQTMH
jgi:hypothetical protein